MNIKRILSGITALALLLCLLPAAVPTAKASSFVDVKDQTVAEQVEVLRMLGVIDGVGGNRFDPNGTLTRAQFAKMAVTMQGKKNAAAQFQNYTIFPDVRASHWAAGYVNLSVRGEGKILAGYPDGKFHPDEKISFAQTVTILMRVLGYKDEDVGAVWPQGYLSTAAYIGLTDGISLPANAKLTRAQAAKLFCKLLRMETKEGALFIEQLGTPVKDVILVEVNTKAADGTPNAIRTQDNKIYKMANGSMDASMAGRKGTLLLGKSERVLTFIPEESSKKTVTIAEAKADLLVDMNGTKYPIHSEVTTYVNGEAKPYSEVFPDLRSGTSVTMLFNGAGTLEYIFAGAAKASDAVIVAKQGSTLGFERLTNSTTYTIYKNGVQAAEGDLRQYDVATFDAGSNAIRVSDTRLSGYYDSAEPNLQSPTKITVLGHVFSVLPGAAESLSQFKIGQQVTLLLTEDNQVAGAVDPSKVQGNAVGIATVVTEDSAEVELFCGLTVKGNPHLSQSSIGQYQGQLVKVTSYQKGGQISLSRVSSGNARGDLYVPERKLGERPLADNVRIYDKVGNSALKPVTWKDIPETKIPASGILYAEKNYADKVSILVLNNATGDAFTYGRYVFTPAKHTEDGEFAENATITVENGRDKIAPVECGGGYRNGDFGGLAFQKNSSGEGRLAGTAQLTKLKDVPNSAWNGSTSVSFRGATYAVSDEVVCYNQTTEQWVTLSAARAFAQTADLYYDSVGEKIRIVVVKQ